MIKIAVFDGEQSYVERLAAYLNQFGKRLWSVAAFTDEEILEKQLEQGRVDVVAGTKQDWIKGLQQRFPRNCYVWLSDQKGQQRIGAEGGIIYMIYRYQGAGQVGESLKDIVEYTGLTGRSAKRAVVFYSPVGRCGKTMLAKQLVRQSIYGKWLYIGMEDYGCCEEEERQLAEDFLYYLKERNEGEVKGILERVSGIISSAFSPVDTRQVDRTDLEWFLKLFEEVSAYTGVVFDIGTGVLNSFTVLTLFELVVVPYLTDAASMGKRQQLEELLRVCGFPEILEKVHYINMEQGGDPMGELQVLLQ